MVALEDAALRRGNKHTLLHLLEQQPVTFLRRTAFGGVPDDVNRPAKRASLGEGGRGHDRVPSETRVSAFAEVGARVFAIGAPLPFHARARQHLVTLMKHHVRDGHSQALHHRAVQLQDTEVRVVHQDHILDGIEGADPLPVRADDLFQQPQVLHRDADLVPGRGQEIQFVGRIRPVSRLSQGDRTDHRRLAPDRHQQDVVEALFPHQALVIFLQGGMRA